MTDSSNESSRPANLAPETLAAQALGRIDKITRAIVPPLYASTTYERDPDGGYSSGRGYTRPHNPTYDEPRELLAALDPEAFWRIHRSVIVRAAAIHHIELDAEGKLLLRVKGRTDALPVSGGIGTKP